MFLLKKKLIIIGLDGGTFKLIKPWTEKGHMPNLKKIFDDGTHGILRSTIPPLTGPAWVSMATGKNPWKMGIYEFLNRRNKTYQERMVNSSYMKSTSFWDILSASGKKVGLFGYPMLYPSYEINGFIVSGFGGETAGKWTYPESLGKKIHELVPDYPIQIATREYSDDEDFLNEVINVFEKQKKIIEYLLTSNGEDMLVFVLSMPDWIQHHLWHILDPKHPAYEESHSRKMLPKIISLYSQIDALIGKMMQLNPEANFLIVSDHGFGLRTAKFNLTGWLANKNYLAYDNQNKKLENIKTKSLGVMRWLSRKLRVKARLPFTRSFASNIRLKLSPITSKIDFNRSVAYSLKHKTMGGEVFINLKGRDEHGTVDPAKYEELKKKIVADLRNLPKEFEGIETVEIFDPATEGIDPKTSFVPDILFSINNWKCNIYNSTENCQAEELFEYQPTVSFPDFKGTHRREGIFMAYGPDIKKSYEVNGANIEDVMPTILFIFGHEIPKEVDGKVLEIFSEDSELYGKNPKKETRKIVPGEKRLKLLKEKLQKGGRNDG